MKNQKKTGELKFRDYFGTTAMSVTDGLASTVMTGLFMLYLTDYAGIGQWGAILGSGLLMFARLFDAINDPFEGWLMDRGKITKYGKYRPLHLFEHPHDGGRPVRVVLAAVGFRRQPGDDLRLGHCILPAV